jgi:hypothetical protein
MQIDKEILKEYIGGDFSVVEIHIETTKNDKIYFSGYQHYLLNYYSIHIKQYKKMDRIKKLKQIRNGN